MDGFEIYVCLSVQKCFTKTHNIWKEINDKLFCTQTIKYTETLHDKINCIFFHERTQIKSNKLSKFKNLINIWEQTKTVIFSWTLSNHRVSQAIQKNQLPHTLTHNQTPRN